MIGRALGHHVHTSSSGRRLIPLGNCEKTSYLGENSKAGRTGILGKALIFPTQPLGFIFRVSNFLDFCCTKQ